MSDSLLLHPVVLLVAAALVPIIAVWASRGPRLRRRQVDRFARRVGLPLPDDLRPDLERRMGDRDVGLSVGGGVGLALIALWGMTVGAETVRSSIWMLVVAATVFTGMAVGAGIVALREATRPVDTSAPRVARPTTPTFGDYVAPAELWGGRVVSILPLVLSLGLLLASAVSDLRLGAGAAVASVLALGGLAAAELGGRRILDAPQAAGSDRELAWSDAVRARVLRDVVTVPLSIGTYATIGVLTSIDVRAVEVSAGTVRAGLVGMFAVLVGAGGLALWSASSAPQRHFRRRLWPDVDTPASTAGVRR